jgi:hypothetical protein
VGSDVEVHGFVSTYGWIKNGEHPVRLMLLFSEGLW